MDPKAVQQFDEELVAIIERRIQKLIRMEDVTGAWLEFDYACRLTDRTPRCIMSPDVLDELLRLMPEDDERRLRIDRFAQANRIKYTNSVQSARLKASVNRPELRPFPASIPPLDEATEARLTHDLRNEYPWPLEPLYAAKWEPRAGREAAVLLYRIYSALKNDPIFEPVRERGVKAIRLDRPAFYDGIEIVELLLLPDTSDVAPAAESLVLIVAIEGVTCMNGRADRIYVVNKKIGIRLDSAVKVSHYLRFFCGAVHSEDGGFALIESAEQIRERLWEPQDEAVEQLWKLCEPMTISSPAEGPQDQPHTWKLEAAVQHSTGLFRAALEVETAGGIVKMVNDELLAANIAVNLSVFDGRCVRRKQRPSGSPGQV